MGVESAFILKRLDAAASGAPAAGGADVVFLDLPLRFLADLSQSLGAPDEQLARSLMHDARYEARVLACLLLDPAACDAQVASAGRDALIAPLRAVREPAATARRALPAMRIALHWADARPERSVTAGLGLIADLAALLPPDAENALGFFDHALFQLRKRAAADSLAVREAAAAALLAIAARDGNWKEAAVETAEEIAAQPDARAQAFARHALAHLTET